MKTLFSLISLYNDFKVNPLDRTALSHIGLIWNSEKQMLIFGPSLPRYLACDRPRDSMLLH